MPHFDVLLPYKITLFSNTMCQIVAGKFVLLPYKITLFSNLKLGLSLIVKVLLPYKITLFSNYDTVGNKYPDGFTTI